MSDNFAATSHWRDSARSARFFMVDARAAFPIFLFLMHIRVWTGILVLVSAVFLVLLSIMALLFRYFCVGCEAFLQGRLERRNPGGNKWIET